MSKTQSLAHQTGAEATSEAPTQVQSQATSEAATQIEAQAVAPGEAEAQTEVQSAEHRAQELIGSQEPSQWIGMKEVQELLMCGRKKIERLVADNEIVRWANRKSYLYDRASILAYIDRCTNRAAVEQQLAQAEQQAQEATQAEPVQSQGAHK